MKNALHSTLLFASLFVCLVISWFLGDIDPFGEAEEEALLRTSYSVFCSDTEPLH